MHNNNNQKTVSNNKNEEKEKGKGKIINFTLTWALDASRGLSK